MLNKYITIGNKTIYWFFLEKTGTYKIGEIVNRSNVALIHNESEQIQLKNYFSRFTTTTKSHTSQLVHCNQEHKQSF